MTAVPRIRIPSGHILVEDGEGGFELVRSDERPTKTIGFKVTEEQFAALIPFFESFHERTVSAAMRWLVEHPDVRLVMSQRISSQTKLRRQPRTQNGEL